MLGDTPATGLIAMRIEAHSITRRLAPLEIMGIDIINAITSVIIESIMATITVATIIIAAIEITGTTVKSDITNVSIETVSVYLKRIQIPLYESVLNSV